MQKQRSILSLVLLALFLAVVSVEAKLTPHRKSPVQKRSTPPVQKRVAPKVACGATTGPPRVPLLAAAYYGDIPTLEKLLANGTDVNVKDSYGNTALLAAANHAHTGVVKFLLAKGADSNVINKGGQTPLMYAACLADLESVKALLDKGADVNANDSVAFVWIRPRLDGESNEESEQIYRLFLARGVKVPAEAIFAAAGEKDVRKMNELLSRNPDTKAKNTAGNTALHIAVERGIPEIAQALLAKGAAVNEKNNDGMTPLMIAVEDRRLAMVEVLLNNGADVNVKDNDGETALDYAKGEGDKAVIELLRKAMSGKKVQGAYSADDIFSLVRKGDLAKVQELLRKNPSAVNARDESGATPLHYAAKQNVPELITIFLDNKADVNAEDNGRSTPLHYATGASFRSLDAIKLLLERAADPNADNGADIPFHYAIVFGHTEVVKLMLAYKANVKIKNRDQTPVQLAGRHTEIIKLLRAHGAK